MDVGRHLLVRFVVSSSTLWESCGMKVMCFPNSCVVAGAVRLAYAYKLNLPEGSVPLYSSQFLLHCVTSLLC